jgi:uncharacterized protein YecE (DUF72 family)
MQIQIGTCGYDYPEWIGADRFYPPGLACKRSSWLTYYANQFPLVELNFTYYGHTNPQQLERMLKRVQPVSRLILLEGEFAPQPDFSFVIKAYAGLTHQVDKDWRTLVGKFCDDIAPLQESGKLLGVLAQFPSRFRPAAGTLDYVKQLAAELAPRQLIVEFRHRNWFSEEPTAFLQKHRIVLAGVDAPEEAKLPRAFEQPKGAGPAPGGVRNADPVHGAPFSYYRLHGRRSGAWWASDAASRYEYCYSNRQLELFAKKLVRSQAPCNYVLFNNHRHADAARNARHLEGLLAGLLLNGSKSF